MISSNKAASSKSGAADVLSELGIKLDIDAEHIGLCIREAGIDNIVALRGDLPGRYAHLFGDGGFRYLMEEGVHYTNAHYQHANTETIVGHVSLATGTVPAAQIFRQLPGSKRPKWAALPRASA